VQSAVEGSRQATLKNFATTLNYLREQYQQAPTVVYADLNARCRSCDEQKCTPQDAEVMRLVTSYQLQLVYDDTPSSYTWSNCLHRSYLDFFLVRGATHENFAVTEKIGSSDHRAIELTITGAQPQILRRTT